MKPRSMSLHLVAPYNSFIREDGKTWTSSYIRIPIAEIRRFIGMTVYFHEDKRTRSIFGGKIVRLSGARSGRWRGYTKITFKYQARARCVAYAENPMVKQGFDRRQPKKRAEMATPIVRAEVGRRLRPIPRPSVQKFRVMRIDGCLWCLHGEHPVRNLSDLPIRERNLREREWLQQNARIPS